MKTSLEEQIRSKVRDGYASIATTGGSCCGGASCCGSSPEIARELVQRLGYDPEILETLPEGTNLGLSCGNPQAIASLRPGETVLDLGSGAGFDVFLAAQAVGPAGRAIGVDMTAPMLEKARRNAEAFSLRTKLDNVDFRLGEIEHLPVADASVDVVVSNCVLNLSPDKAQVWREIYRVLRPGGRVAISDIVLLAPVPEGVRELSESLVGCVAGAALVDQMRHWAIDAGFQDLEVVPKRAYVEAMVDVGDSLYKSIEALLPSGSSLADYIASADLVATKPAASEGHRLGQGPGGGEDARRSTPAPPWHESSSCCGASETGCC